MRTWDLFREMEQFQRDIDEVFRGVGLDSFLATGNRSLRHFPRINLREDNENLYLEALLPGVDPAQVDINLLGNNLTLAGERPASQLGGEEGRWHRRERPSGKFMRTIELPVQIDADKVKAEAKHGLLRVIMPKAAVAKPKTIQVKTK